MAELTGADDGQRRVVVLPVTSAHDGLEHLVAEDMMIIGSAGRYTGLCGRRVWAAALACPAGPPCPSCITVRDTSVLGGRRNRRTHRRGMWIRLISWLGRRRRARHAGKPEAAGPGSAATTLIPESGYRCVVQ